MSVARSTYQAEITLGPIETRTGARGPYAIARNSSVRSVDGSTSKRTVMAFGDGLASVGRLLRPSRKLRLSVQMDGGTVVIVGPGAAPRAAKSARSTPSDQPSALTQACIDAAGFADHHRHGC